MKYILIISILSIIMLSTGMLFLFPVFGVFLTAGVIVGLTGIVALDIYDTNMTKILVLLSLIPSLSLLSIALQEKNISLFILFYYLMLFSASIVYLIKIDRNIYLPSLKKILYLPYAVAFGVEVGFMLSVLFNRNATPHAVSLDQAIAGSILMAVTEGLYFQFLFQNLTTKVFSPFFAVIATSLLYILLHGNFTIPSLMVWGLLGLFISSLYTLTKNIYFTILFTIVMNLLYFFFAKNFMSLTI